MTKTLKTLGSILKEHGFSELEKYQYVDRHVYRNYIIEGTEKREVRIFGLGWGFKFVKLCVLYSPYDTGERGKTDLWRHKKDKVIDDE